MTRRDLFRAAAFAGEAAGQRVIVPVRRVMDARARCTPEDLSRFWWSIWPEAYREFDRCGIQLATTDAAGEIRRSPSDRPMFIGLERHVVNLVLTDHIPLYWDNGRGLAGLTMLLENAYHVCLIALSVAHANQAPFLSLNTCVHELLHALMQDIYLRDRPGWFRSGEHESRIDGYATELWLFHGSAAVRESARAYVNRLRR